MIEPFIKERLDDWGAWLRSDCGVGFRMGYPKMDMIQKVREGRIRVTGHKVIYRNPEAERMDLLICKLTPWQRKAIIARFYWRMSDRRAADIFRISHQTHCANVHSAAKALSRLWHSGACIIKI